MDGSLGSHFIHIFAIRGPSEGTDYREITIQNFSFVETCLRNTSKSKKLFCRLTPYGLSYGIKICDPENEHRVLQKYVHHYNMFKNPWRRSLARRLMLQREEPVTLRFEAETVSGSLKIFIDGHIVAYISDTTMKRRDSLTVEGDESPEDKLVEWHTEAMVKPHDFFNNINVKRLSSQALSLKELAFRRSEKYLYIKDSRGEMVQPPSPLIPEDLLIRCELEFRYHPISFDNWCPQLHPRNLRAKGYTV